ncbi:unnamed protein product [Chironomus riparius]|uniref:Uncharacterized protein n=1 Tax=Chironomus riparius TaxID=315576 RepID=A0A9N9X005_9DIPT|nr:unnamed protein product [Chironomus riparius]
MVKLVIAFISIAVALFGSSQSATFECDYKAGAWGTLGTTYYCLVSNSAIITSPDEAQVYDISGTHLAGHNDDNVGAFYNVAKGQIHYFPRGIAKFLKNLKGIYFRGTGLKEIHQSDLRPYPKLANLYLYISSLEVLEKDLFKFNPNLDYIYLKSNKISHIDSNVFDNLPKLKTLYLESNNCVNMKAEDNPTEVQNIIKIVKSHCTNSDFSNLLQNVKNLEIESKNLNLEKFKEKLENLNNEVKNSKFRPRQAARLKISLESKVDGLAANLKDLVAQATNGTDCGHFQGLKTILDEKVSKFDEKLTKTVSKMDRNIANLKEVSLTSTDTASTSPKSRTEISKLDDENFDIKLEVFEENLINFKTFAFKKIDKMEIDEKVFRASTKKTLEKLIEEVERKFGEIEAKLEEKFDEIDGKFEKIERKLEEILKIVKSGE